MGAQAKAQTDCSAARQVRLDVVRQIAESHSRRG